MIEYSDKIIELAKDTNVEMVVCAVRVDRHFPTISPSLRAGKSAFVEWPLGKNLAEAQELAKLSKEHGAKRTAVDLQARFAPIVRTLKRLTEEGRVGKVLSSTWTGYGGNGGPTESESMKYLADKEVGGNLVTIHLGHVVDYVQQSEYSSPISFPLKYLKTWFSPTLVLFSHRTFTYIIIQFSVPSKCPTVLLPTVAHL